ncbi:MAG: zinc-binding alcohol dehydrogenase [Clostridia bacterium]|nr:zinc-binding alcohol dehydrogenase [Clostridia bacterium]
MTKAKTIVFTKLQTAELIEKETATVTGDRVKVKMEYTVVSGGTERACIMGMNNTPQQFPMSLGYCGVGYVTEIGAAVKEIKIGDRVLVYHGIHTEYNVIPESDVTKVEDNSIDSLDAAFVIIASMGLGGVRKLEVELGESAMVMGLGLLGMFSVQFLRLSGANPLIAVDLNPKRRDLALKFGADYALDPSDEDFVEKVKTITKSKGVRATVEVTGVSAAMKQAIECASWMGRISLLGCTRVSDCSVDYYQQVHRPGVKLIGAHNFVRPKVESYPHHWTHHDDCRAILDMIATNRIDVKSIVSRIVKPEDAPQIYTELCNNKEFPIGTVFDWR